MLANVGEETECVQKKGSTEDWGAVSAGDWEGGGESWGLGDLVDEECELEECSASNNWLEAMLALTALALSLLALFYMKQHRRWSRQKLAVLSKSNQHKTQEPYKCYVVITFPFP